MNAPITERLFKRIKTLSTSGMSGYRIAKGTGLPYATIYGILKDPNLIWHRKLSQIAKLEAFFVKNSKKIKVLKNQITSWDEITPQMVKDAKHALKIGKPLNNTQMTDISDFTGINISSIYRLNHKQTPLKSAYPKTIYKLYKYDAHVRKSYHERRRRKQRKIRQIKAHARKQIEALNKKK